MMEDQLRYHEECLSKYLQTVPKMREIIDTTPFRPAYGTDLAMHCKVNNRRTSLVIESCCAALLPHIDKEEVGSCSIISAFFLHGRLELLSIISLNLILSLTRPGANCRFADCSWALKIKLRLKFVIDKKYRDCHENMFLSRIYLLLFLRDCFDLLVPYHKLRNFG